MAALDAPRRIWNWLATHQVGVNPTFEEHITHTHTPPPHHTTPGIACAVCTRWNQCLMFSFQAWQGECKFLVENFIFSTVVHVLPEQMFPPWNRALPHIAQENLATLPLGLIANRLKPDREPWLGHNWRTFGDMAGLFKPPLFCLSQAVPAQLAGRLCPFQICICISISSGTKNVCKASSGG